MVSRLGDSALHRWNTRGVCFGVFADRDVHITERRWRQLADQRVETDRRTKERLLLIAVSPEGGQASDRAEVFVGAFGMSFSNSQFVAVAASLIEHYQIDGSPVDAEYGRMRRASWRCGGSLTLSFRTPSFKKRRNRPHDRITQAPQLPGRGGQIEIVVGLHGLA